MQSLSELGEILNMKSKSIIATCFILFLTSISFAQMKLDWVQRHPSSIDRAVAFGVCVDSSGNVYVTGGVQAATSLYLCTIIKYIKNGEIVWLRNYQRPGNSHNIGFDIAIDDSGNVYVAGGFLIKYNRTVDLQWAGLLDSCVFYKMVLDSSGNVYAAGGTGGGLRVVKYNPDGIRTWTNSAGQVSDINDLILDKSNNLLIAVEATGPSPTGIDYNYGTLKYSSFNGSLIWRRTYNGTSFSTSPYDFAYAVASDLKNNVYVTGASTGLNGHFNCTTLKYDSAGNEIWLKRIYPPSNGYDLAVDELQNVYIASMSNGNNYTMKLDSNASLLWTRTYPTTYPYSTNRNVIFLDSVNNVYISGNSDSISATSYAALKYDKDGNFKFVVCYGYAPYVFSYVQDMVVDRNGSVYLTGESGSAYATVKFSEILTGINNNNINFPSAYKLEQNYPNPFNPETIINYELPLTVLTQLKVYDALGREVLTRVNGILAPGSYGYQFSAADYQLSSGIYFYTLKAGEYSLTKRMVLLK